MNKNSEPKRSAASWLMELAEGQRGEYALSILAAARRRLLVDPVFHHY